MKTLIQRPSPGLASIHVVNPEMQEPFVRTIVISSHDHPELVPKMLMFALVQSKNFSHEELFHIMKHIERM